MVSNNNAAGDDDTDLNWKKKVYTVAWNAILSILRSQMDLYTSKMVFCYPIHCEQNLPPPQKKLFWWVFSVQTCISLHH